MNSDIALSALALVERCLLQDGEGIAALSSVIPPEERGQLATSLAIILAGYLETREGVAGGIERVHGWRTLYLDAAADE